MIHALAIVNLLLYGIALLLSVVCVFHDSPLKRRLVDGTFVAGFAAHLALLYYYLLEQRPQFLLSGADYFFWLSLIVAIAYLWLRRTIKFPMLAVFLISADLLFLASSSYLVHTAPLRALHGQTALLLGFHVMPAILAEACLCVASGLSAVFLMQEHRLKGRRPQLLTFRGPSLEWLSRVSRWSVSAGFIAMSIAILSGCLWSYVRGQAFLRGDVSVLVAILAWGFLGYIHIGKYLQRWSARRLSVVTILSTISILLAFVCIRLFSGTVMHGNPGV